MSIQIEKTVVAKKAAKFFSIMVANTKLSNVLELYSTLKRLREK